MKSTVLFSFDVLAVFGRCYRSKIEGMESSVSAILAEEKVQYTGYDFKRYHYSDYDLRMYVRHSELKVPRVVRVIFQEILTTSRTNALALSEY